jgi:predicted RND superfamily exporter protein
VREVMRHLFTPMLYTSITSAVGFASLALTPIPPVQVFGFFVAFGILLAFALTVPKPSRISFTTTSLALSISSITELAVVETVFFISLNRA